MVKIVRGSIRRYIYNLGKIMSPGYYEGKEQSQKIEMLKGAADMLAFKQDNFIKNLVEALNEKEPND
jgi:hypothetical protein